MATLTEERTAKKKAEADKVSRRRSRIRDMRNQRDKELGILANRHATERNRLWDSWTDKIAKARREVS